ncbi:MAG TPA: class I SAM-dependent methyltransferase [Bacteroidota bacterium]|nr:class I SAM-dependent methyltransferase [Bacteroidota bacterium]
MEEELYRKFYEVEMAHWWFSARQIIIMDLIRRKLDLPAGAKVLDVGCGTGAILSKLSERFEAYGTDTSDLAIEFCHRRGLSNAFCCTLETFPHPEIRFDLVTMLDVIEHIDDDLAVVRQAMEVLRPEGHLLVTVPAYQFLWSRHDELNHHKRRYTQPLLRHVLEQAGFTVEMLSHYNTFLFPTALLERMAAKVVAMGTDTTLKIPPLPINTLLKSIFSFERHILGKTTFPFGLSVIALAKRPS